MYHRYTHICSHIRVTRGYHRSCLFTRVRRRFAARETRQDAALAHEGIAPLTTHDRNLDAGPKHHPHTGQFVVARDRVTIVSLC